MPIMQQLVIFLSAVTDPAFFSSSSFFFFFASFSLAFCSFSLSSFHFISLTSHVAVTLCCYHMDACASFLHLFLVAFHFSLPFLDVFFLS